MNCPACQQPMQEMALGQVTVDRCTGCQGIWFDSIEREQLMALPGATESLDTDSLWERNPPDVGALASKPGGYKAADCPRCQVGMEPVWIQRTKNVERGALVFEQCEKCRGSFFDAGEFSDLVG